MRDYKEIIESLSFDELVELWSVYSQNNGCSDDYIYNDIDELLEIVDWSADEAIRRVFYGNVESLDNYVYLNGNANVESATPSNNPIDMGLLAEWHRIEEYLIDNGFIDEEEEEEEE